MTGKVKCTCGWSWNKSDSSKKDMYICHECGRDNSNNMKDGGWLDNYNDSEVSLPEGFVGEGIFNGPKFDNPAWGGQFQMGGTMPGAVGHMYARHGAPSKGPRRNQTDVTDASAQNGKEMQYYQNGLDFTPKSISKNGAWLDNYEEAQNGKKFKLKDERELAYKTAESTNVKKKNFDLEQSKSNKSYINQLAEQQKENKRRKALTQDQREREDYNARNEERGSIQAPVKESKWDRTKAIVSNPLTAFGYAARNESLPTRFQHGERNTLDNAIDWINPLQGIAAASEIPGELSRGEYLNAGLSTLDAIDLGVYAKGAIKASKPLLQKAGQQLGNVRMSIAPELRQGLQTNGISFANNPKRGENAFKLINDDNKEWIGDLDLTKNYWDDAAKDQWTIENVGIEKSYRGKGLGKEAYMKANELLNSTNRGDLYSSGMFEGPDAKHLWRSLVKSGEAEEIGKNAWKFKSKFEQGGIIKDDRGQWDHPGEITEIGSNEITMEGVPYDVLGVSDTGDTKLMKPGKNYKFKGKKVTEYPMAQNGLRQEQKGLQNLDNLTNFTNYNKPQPGGWLNKYN